MLAFVSSPATMPRFRFGSSAAEALNAAQVTDTIWNLHSILVNPASTSADAKGAKKRMLRVLEGAKHLLVPQMIVPSIALSPGPADDETNAAELLDDEHVCATCKCPISADVRNRAAPPKRDRANLAASC